MEIMEIIMKRFTALLFVAALCAVLLCGCAKGDPVFKSTVVPGIFSSDKVIALRNVFSYNLQQF